MSVFLATYFETNGHFDSNVKLFPVIYANYRTMTDAKRKPWYVASVFLPRVIYENVDIVFIGIYNKHLSYPLSILKVIFVKSN